MPLTASHIEQLQLLKAFDATSSEAAINRYSQTKYDGGGRKVIASPARLRPLTIGQALVPLGLAGSRRVRSQYGRPQQTLYWITDDGLAALARQPIGGRA